MAEFKMIYVCKDFGMRHELFKNAKGKRCDCGANFISFACNLSLYNKCEDYNKVRVEKIKNKVKKFGFKLWKS